MTIQEWGIERQRAWTVIYAAVLNAHYAQKMIRSVEEHTEDASWSADEFLKGWEKRFPKPKN
jgi:hypothetical protein